MNSKVLRYRPLAEVSFTTEQGELVARANNDPSNKNMDNDVLSITTSRDMGSDAPTFCITLARRNKWHRYLGANDLVKIRMCRPPEEMRTVMIGLIDDVRNRVVIGQDGKPERVITVTGRGMVKAFMEFDVGIVSDGGEAAIDLNGNFGWVDAVLGTSVVGSNPDVIIQNVIDNIVNEYVKYTWSDKNTFETIVNYHLTARPDLVLVDGTSIVSYQGDLWGFFKTIAEPPFQELYWEVDMDKLKMILRPTPFSENGWKTLRDFTITDADIVMDETGRSDVETYSLYSVGAKAMFVGGDTNQMLGVKPIWNEDYSDKYGIRRLHTETAYTSIAEKSDGADMVDTIVSMSTDLYNWNIKNNSMYNGVLVVKGSNQYKVGCKITYKSDEDGTELTYYIRSVTQNFVNFGSWVTQLEVTRGIEEKDRFTPPYGTGTEFTGTGYAPLASSLGGGDNCYGGGTGTSSASASAVVEGAIAWMNKGTVKYTFGADNMEGGKADCSSFTKYIFSKYANVQLSRTTDGQAKAGQSVPKSSALPGDLVIFQGTYRSGPSHCGIMIGGDEFIHNSSSKSITKDKLSSSYWSKHFHSIRRVITNNAPSSEDDSSNSGYTGEFPVAKNLLTNTKTFRKKDSKNTWIVIHNTAGGNTAAGIRNWFNGGAGGANTSTHYVVGDDGIMQLLEDNWAGGHTGKPPKPGTSWYSNYLKSTRAGDNGCSNSTAIGIEICDGGSTEAFKARVEKAIELTRYLMNKHGIPSSRVVRHLDISGKPCPGYMIGKDLGGNTVKYSWSNFKTEIDLRNKNKTPIKVGGISGGGGSSSCWDYSSGSNAGSATSEDAKKLDACFGGKLKNTGNWWVKYANQHNIDVYIAAAISMHETGNGTSDAIKYKNNPGGLYDSKNKRLFSYKSLEEGINKMCSNLQRLYFSEGRNTLEKIQPKYCPIGASNDPHGLNKHWLPGTNKYLKQLKNAKV